MSKFIHPQYRGTWKPKPGQWVVGDYGKNTTRGVVLPSRKNPLKPALFKKNTFVGCLVENEFGRKITLSNVRPHI